MASLHRRKWIRIPGTELGALTESGKSLGPAFLYKVIHHICIRTANEGPARIQCKCMVPIYVFPEMELLFPKQNYNVLAPTVPILIYLWDIYIVPGSVCLSCCRGRCELILGLYKSLTDTGLIMNEEIGTEAEQFSEEEYINGIFLAVRT